jgi:heme-degrading monooxygenase HmoA
MILEIAELKIKDGSQAAFEAAVNEAVPLFRRAKGCNSMRLDHSIEAPTQYRLVVGWATVENHMVDFRESADFLEWRKLVEAHFDGAPNVFHTSTAVSGF